MGGGMTDMESEAFYRNMPSSTGLHVFWEASALPQVTLWVEGKQTSLFLAFKCFVIPHNSKIEQTVKNCLLDPTDKQIYNSFKVHDLIRYKPKAYTSCFNEGQ